MSLRSVDMQVLLPKVSEVNRNQPIQNQQDQTQQQQFAAQMQKQSEMQRQQIQNSDKPEGAKVDRQAREKRGGADREPEREKKGRSGEEGAPEVKDPGKGNLLDIKI